jgi:hypothetical protein
MSADEARDRAAAIRRSIDESLRLLGLAFTAGDHGTLGYASCRAIAKSLCRRLTWGYVDARGGVGQV